MKRTVDQWERKRRAIYRSKRGCKCPKYFDGERCADHERCSEDAIRCNERLAVVQDRLRELGPRPPIGTDGPAK